MLTPAAEQDALGVVRINSPVHDGLADCLQPVYADAGGDDVGLQAPPLAPPQAPLPRGGVEGHLHHTL